MEALARWLYDLGLGEYAQDFADNDIDFDVLPHLTDQDLKDLGLSIGHRRRFLIAASQLADDQALHFLGPSPVNPGGPNHMGDAERRQMSVMFCDLVGSTALSTQLDPEELSELMRVYRDACAIPIERYGGFVARFIGDGILAYFGYPQAHEDDAERAIRAGLGMIDAMQDLQDGIGREKEIHLAARLGIATGNVVVGDIIGNTQAEQNAVVGEAPNVAARLQGLAQPNTLVVDPETRRLAGQRFEYLDVGQSELKGIQNPVPVCQVVAVREFETRFAARSAPLTPLVGRVEEMDLLKRRWQAAKDGAGQVILVSGEPGIGKSRIAEALHEHLEQASEPEPQYLNFQCSPHYSNTPLHPFIKQLEGMAGIQQVDTADEKLAKLEQVVDVSTEEREYTLVLFADLLAIPVRGRYPALDLTARQKRDRTMSALGIWFNAACARRSVVAVFEDVHWIDPTSQALLDDLISRTRRSRALVIVTYRPEFSAPWVGQSHVSALTLNRLGERDTTALVQAVAGGKSLPTEFVEEILNKTDGVPLFVEEFAKGVITSNVLESDNGGFVPRAPASSVGIPSSIHGPLMSRVDQLGPAKVVAQMGAAIGREFSSTLLSRVSCLSEEELTESLKELTKSELVFERGLPPHTTYEFKHALIQEAAYESVLKRTRKKLHLRIAQALKEQDEDVPEASPEILAFHYWRAGAARRAIDNWKRAADRAFERSALVEAERHLRNAIQALAKLKESEERSLLELALSLQLGTALRATRGYGTPEIERLYLRAREIFVDLGNMPERFNAEWALMQIYLVQGKLDSAKDVADWLIGYAEDQQDDELRMDANLARGMASLHLGRFEEAEGYLGTSARLYRPGHHKPRQLTHGQDPGVFAQGFHHWCLWFAGRPDESRQRIAETVALAREISHPFSLVSALTFAVRVHHCLRDFDGVKMLTEELIAITRDGGYEYYEAVAAIHRGWALALDDGDEAAIGPMLEGLETQRRLGTVLGLRGLLVELAEAYWRFGKKTEALSALDQAWVEGGTHCWDVEVHRVRGEILGQGTQEEQADAEGAFRAGLETSLQQSTPTLELRIATSCARLLQDQGRIAEANALLGPVVEKRTIFKFTAPDIDEAAKLLKKHT